MTYQGSHRPRDDGPPAFDLLAGEMVPGDVYTHPHFYSTDDTTLAFIETVEVLRMIRGKPNAKVEVFRASPRNELNNGDWVALSKHYARQHGLDPLDPDNDMDVYKFVVPANTLIWSIDSLEEFGYFGPVMFGTRLKPWKQS